MVTAGLTETLLPATVPTPWSIASEVALDADQDNVELLPAAMVVGDAVKLEIDGAATTVTVTCLVAVAPTELVAVSV